MTRRRALFLDRDGVINVDHGYVSKIADFEFIDGIFDLCRFAASVDAPIVVVTNQAGIGRGFYTQDDFDALTRFMRARFIAEGAPLADVLFDPTHPDAAVSEHRRDSHDRKPNPGMLLKAAERYMLDLPHSAMIGDKQTDMLAARRAGVETRIWFGHEAEAAPGDETLRAQTMAQALRLLRAAFGEDAAPV